MPVKIEARMSATATPYVEEGVASERAFHFPCFSRPGSATRRDGAVRSLWYLRWAVTVLALNLLAAPALAQTSTDNTPGPMGSGFPANIADRLGNCTAPLNVCYYDLGTGQGNANQVAPITAAGHTPVDVVTPDAAGLNSCDLFFVQNPSNSTWSSEWMTNQSAITAAVQAGMPLVFHDRRITDAASGIPGLSGATCTREVDDPTNPDAPSRQVNIRERTQATVGLTDTNLDLGNQSSHGHCTARPAGSVSMLSRNTDNESVLFSYPLGASRVTYSTMPLDFYLDNTSGEPNNTFATVYAPNVIRYGGSFCAAGVPLAPPWALVLLLFVLLLIPVSFLRRRHQLA